jgi:hypothetical protein
VTVQSYKTKQKGNFSFNIDIMEKYNSILNEGKGTVSQNTTVIFGGAFYLG